SPNCHVPYSLRSSTLLTQRFFLLMFPPPPRSTLFPYTTLFRSMSSCRTIPPEMILSCAFGLLSKVSQGPTLHLNQLIAAFNVKRSEEHTSELQSRFDLVCRLLLEKKKYYIMSIVFISLSVLKEL